MQSHHTKNFGPYMERTLRKVRLYLIRGFKEAQIDITPEQFILLSNLYENDGQSQSDLGELTYKNKPTISRIIDLLDKKGLTKRVKLKEDKRVIKVFLTDKGKATVEKAYPIVLEAREKGWKGLSDEDFQHLVRIMNTIFDNF